MNQPWAALIAYLSASLCVAGCWAVFSAASSGRMDLFEVLGLWVMLFVLVSASAAVPVGAMRGIALLSGQTSFLVTTLSGAVVGAAMFWLVFGTTWASGNSLSALLPFFASGGALGALGGGVFYVLETRLLKRENDYDEYA